MFFLCGAKLFHQPPTGNSLLQGAERVLYLQNPHLAYARRHPRTYYRSKHHHDQGPSFDSDAQCFWQHVSSGIVAFQFLTHTRSCGRQTSTPHAHPCAPSTATKTLDDSWQGVHLLHKVFSRSTKKTIQVLGRFWSELSRACVTC
jgi:hypothetical protein